MLPPELQWVIGGINIFRSSYIERKLLFKSRNVKGKTDRVSSAETLSLICWTLAGLKSLAALKASSDSFILVAN